MNLEILIKIILIFWQLIYCIFTKKNWMLIINIR